MSARLNVRKTASCRQRFGKRSPERGVIARKLVLCDFDGTLTRHDSFPGFARFVGGWLFWLYFPLVAWHTIGLWTQLEDAQKAKERVLALFCRGWSPERMRRAGERYAKSLLRRKGGASFWPGALEKLGEHRELGDRVVVVSASPEEWVEPVARELGVECIATRLLYDETGFTGAILGRNCYGEEKVRRIMAHVPDLGDYAVLAYGDSPGDAPMFALAEEAVYRPFE